MKKTKGEMSRELTPSEMGPILQLASKERSLNLELRAVTAELKLAWATVCANHGVSNYVDYGLEGNRIVRRRTPSVGE